MKKNTEFFLIIGIITAVLGYVCIPDGTCTEQNVLCERLPHIALYTSIGPLFSYRDVFFTYFKSKMYIIALITKKIKKFVCNTNTILSFVNIIESI